MELPLENIKRFLPDVQRKIILEVADLTQTLQEKYKFAQELDKACQDPNINEICTIKDLKRNIWVLLYQHDISQNLPFTKNSQVDSIKFRYFFALEGLLKNRVGGPLTLAAESGYEKVVELLLEKEPYISNVMNAVEIAKKGNNKEIKEMLENYEMEHREEVLEIRSWAAGIRAKEAFEDAERWRAARNQKP